MLFDAHNHIHLGPTPTTKLVPTTPPAMPFAGIACMSTHPRDYDVVASVCAELTGRHGLHAVPCFGVHPWFVHELSDDDDAWSAELAARLARNPHSCVGEIGLDGKRWTDPVTRALSTSMERQQRVFETQLALAASMDRPVSVHAVHAWGPFFASIRRSRTAKTLPSKIYLHAFGGKPMVVKQVLQACGPKTVVYFGFAPCVNFRSHRVTDVIRAVGGDRLLLETDRENEDLVYEELIEGAQRLAEALDLSVEEVVERSYRNAKDFYGF